MAMASGALGALTFFVFVFTAQSEVQLLQKHVHKVTQSSDLSHQEVFADATLYQALCNSIKQFLSYSFHIPFTSLYLFLLTR